MRSAGRNIGDLLEESCAEAELAIRRKRKKLSSDRPAHVWDVAGVELCAGLRYMRNKNTSIVIAIHHRVEKQSPDWEITSVVPRLPAGRLLRDDVP